MKKQIIFSFLLILFLAKDLNSKFCINRNESTYNVKIQNRYFGLSIIQDDITKSNCQSIVNAANDQLKGGSGVCGAIFNAAGWENLTDACQSYKIINGARCPVGHAKITDSFNLKQHGINYIIHTVGPDCRIIKDPAEQDKLLANAYINSLKLADQYNIESIAFPFISSGIYAFPNKRACQIALEAINNYLENSNTKTKNISFVLFSEKDYQLFCDTVSTKFKDIYIYE